MSEPQKPTIYIAADHAGFALKNELIPYIENELGYSVVDAGARVLDPDDDYPDFVGFAAKSVAEVPGERKGIVIGGSGQGEAIAAKRFNGVRAVVYYGNVGSQTDASGENLDIISSSRIHNSANVLSLGARFISVEEAKKAVTDWLRTEFSAEERHLRRINKIDKLNP